VSGSDLLSYSGTDLKRHGTLGGPFARKVRIFFEKKLIRYEYIAQRGHHPALT